jgi:hypothetical protein
MKAHYRDRREPARKRPFCGQRGTLPYTTLYITMTTCKRCQRRMQACNIARVLNNGRLIRK